MDTATTAAAFAIALGLIEVLKLAIGKISNGKNGRKDSRLCLLGRDSPGFEVLEQIGESLKSVDDRTRVTAIETHDLYESHKPVGGRLLWYFPPEMLKKQDAILDAILANGRKLGQIAGHLETISNGGRK